MKRYLSIFVASVATLTVGFAQNPTPVNPTLKGFLNYALEYNYDIQDAKEIIREQEGLIVEVKASILPSASITGNYSIKEENLVYGGVTPSTGANENWGLALEINQLVYSGGGIRAALKAQRFTRESVKYALTNVVHQVMYDVRVSFYDALLAKEKIVVEEKNIEYLKEQLKTARDRFDVNTVSKLDVLRAEVEVANAQPALIRARNAYRLAVDELYQTIGYQTNANHVYSGSEVIGNLEFSPIRYDLQRNIRQALESRPDYLQRGSIIRALEAGVDVAKAGYLPTVSLFGGFEYDKNPMSDGFMDSMDGWKIGVSSSWAIFDGRKTKGKMIQARSQLRQAELKQRKAELEVGVDVRRAISALQEASELAQAAEKVVEQAEEALRLAKVRYEAGATTQVELLEATSSLTEAQTNQLSANYSYLVATSLLKRATGDNNF